MKCCLTMSKRKGVNSCSKGLHLNAGREQIELETSTFPRCKTPFHYHCSSPIIFLFLFFNQPLNCNAQLSVSLAVSFVQSTSSPFPPKPPTYLHYRQHLHSGGVLPFSILLGILYFVKSRSVPSNDLPLLNYFTDLLVCGSVSPAHG